MIKTKLCYDTLSIELLLKDNKLYPNNVVAYDHEGNQLWKINDILKIQTPCGISVIKKSGDHIMSAISSAGILYVIDVTSKEVVSTSLMR